MPASPSTGRCRSCHGVGLETIVDLGAQPDPDWLLDDASAQPAPEAGVRLVICPQCGLVQLAGPRPEGPRPPHGHAVSAPAGDPWVDLIVAELGPGPKAVCDVDGSGAMPGSAFAAGGPVRQGMGDEEADLILLGHALNHVDDLDDTLRWAEASLAPSGLIAIDFHHVLGLVRGQVDVISHAHRTYLSLLAVERALGRHGLGAVAVRRIDQFGGTIRVLAARHVDRDLSEPIGDAHDLRRLERDASLDRSDGFAGVSVAIEQACDRLHEFFDSVSPDSPVVGYGASSRGTSLLNIAGIGTRSIPLVVDRAPSKQGKFLPRSMIPVGTPGDVDRLRPAYILVLPWPSAPEISRQMGHVREWGARFVVPLPELRIL